MADLATDIRTYFKTISGITDLVGQGVAARIYEDDAKQGQATPYIVFFITPGESYEDIDGPIGWDTNRVTVMSYANSRAEAYTLAKAVKTPLHGHRGTLGSRTVRGVTAVGSFDYSYDKPTTGGNQRRYWCAQGYLVTHSES